LPIEGVSSEMLLADVTSAEKYLLEKSELLPFLAQHKPNILLTLGAGDIDVLVAPIKQLLEGK
jgi:UDP-N-acetylmuramate--alanine ligase